MMGQHGQESTVLAIVEAARIALKAGSIEEDLAGENVDPPVPIATIKNKNRHALFKKNCSTCHAEDRGTADPPLLVGVEERVKDKQLLSAWIRNSQSVLNTGKYLLQ